MNKNGFLKLLRSTVDRFLDATGVSMSPHAPQSMEAALPPPSYGIVDGRDTVFVLDRSGSMGSGDYVPSRMAGGIQALHEYVQKRVELGADDRVALIIFNHAAKILHPLSSLSDKNRLFLRLAKLKADGGTDIAEGFKAAEPLFMHHPPEGRTRHILLLTDGQGGDPIPLADRLKHQWGVVIDIIGIGGSTLEVNESLLRDTATTDPDGFNHYRFIEDTKQLKDHFRHLATGLVWEGDHD
jgi:hypothetical protein